MSQEPFDNQKVVSITAPIVGGIGGFVVSAIVLVLTLQPTPDLEAQRLLALAAGLLGVGMIGSLAGAFSLAAVVGMPSGSTAVPAATMWMTAAPSIGIVSMFGAFQVLAVGRIPNADALFSLMTLITAWSATYLNTFALVEEWDVAAAAGISSKAVSSRSEALRLSLVQLAWCFLFPLIALVVHLGQWLPHLSTAAATAVSITLMIVAVVSAAIGLARTVTPKAWVASRTEHVAAPIAMSLAMALVILVLPRA